MSTSFMSVVMRKAKGMMLRHIPMMITCRDFETFILDYLEDALPNRQRLIFEGHLRVCRECRDYLAAYERSVEVTQYVFAKGDAPVPPDVPEDLVRAVLEARKR